MVEKVAALMVFVDEEVGPDFELCVAVRKDACNSLLDRGTLPDISQYEGGNTPNYPDVGFKVVLVACAEARESFRRSVGIGMVNTNICRRANLLRSCLLCS